MKAQSGQARCTPRFMITTVAFIGDLRADPFHVAGQRRSTGTRLRQTTLAQDGIRGRAWMALLAATVGVLLAAPLHAQARSAETVVDVTTFGVDPTGKHDSAAVVAKALRQAKAVKGRCVRRPLFRRRR